MKNLTDKHSFLNKEFIAYEILPWLPCKDLCKFKTVCKLWGDTISNDPNFSTFQSQNSQSSLVVCAMKTYFFFVPTTTQNPQSFPTHYLGCMFNDFRVVASNNGFLCGFSTNNEQQHISVYNSLTKYHKIIHLRSYFLTLGFAFNPRERCYYVVCPYYSRTNRNDGFVDIGIKVWSSKENEGWRTSMAKLEGVDCMMLTRFNGAYKCKSISVCGKLYWVKSQKDLLWYDIKSDSAGILVVPWCDEEGEGESSEIGEFYGELSYTVLLKRNMRVWLLKNFGRRESKWVMKYELDVELLTKGELGSIDRPMPYVGGDIVFFSEASKLWSYNFITKEVKLITKYWNRESSLHSYKPSLAHLPD